MMVKKTIVHRDSSITFIFRNKNQITLGAQPLQFFSFPGNRSKVHTPLKKCTPPDLS